MNKTITFVRDKWPVWTAIGLLAFLLISLFMNLNKEIAERIVFVALLSILIPAVALILISIHHIIKAEWSLNVLPKWFKISSILPYTSLAFIFVLFLIKEQVNITNGYNQLWFVGIRTLIILGTWNFFFFKFSAKAENNSKIKSFSVSFVLVFLLTSFLLVWDIYLLPFGHSQNAVKYFEVLILAFVFALSITNFSVGKNDGNNILNLNRYLLLFLFIWLYIIFTQNLIIWYADNLVWSPPVITMLAALVFVILMTIKSLRVKLWFLRAVSAAIMTLLLLHYLF